MIYYINIAYERNLSKRELREKIKNKEYQRMPIETKNKIVSKDKIEVKDLMKIRRIIEEKEEKDMSTIQERVRDWFNEAEARVNEMEAKLNKAEEKIKENEEKEEKAIKEAKKETLKDVIIRMLKIQLTYDTIEQLTGASIEEIKEVRDELICQKI